MTDHETVARGLTSAEKDAVLAMHGRAYRSWPESRLQAMLSGLGKYGLNTLRDKGLAIKGPPWELTTLGLLVLAILQRQEKKG